MTNQATIDPRVFEPNFGMVFPSFAPDLPSPDPEPLMIDDVEPPQSPYHKTGDVTPDPGFASGPGVAKANYGSRNSVPAPSEPVKVLPRRDLGKTFNLTLHAGCAWNDDNGEIGDVNLVFKNGTIVGFEGNLPPVGVAEPTLFFSGGGTASSIDGGDLDA